MEIRLATFSPQECFFDEKIKKNFLLLCAESEKEKLEKLLPQYPFSPDDLRKAVDTWETIPSFFILCEKNSSWFACATNDWAFKLFSEEGFQTIPIDGTPFSPSSNRFLIAPISFMQRFDDQALLDMLKNPYKEDQGLKNHLIEQEKAWIVGQAAFPTIDEMTIQFDGEKDRLRKRSKATSIGMALATLGMIASIGYHFYSFQPKAIDDPMHVIRLENSRFLNLQKKFEEQLVLSLKEASQNQAHKIVELCAQIEKKQELINFLEEKLENSSAQAIHFTSKSQTQEQLINELNGQLHEKNQALQNLQNHLAQLDEQFKAEHEQNINLTSQSSQISQKNQRLEEQLVEQTKAIESLLLTTNEAKEKADKLIDENMKYTKLNKELTLELAQLQNIHEDVIKKEKENELAHQTYLTELKRQVHEQQKALAALQQSRTQLNDELKQIRSEQKEIRSKPSSNKAVAMDLKTHTHIVKSGETLSTISEKYYGTSKRWKEIWDANSQQISNPYQIKVGSSLIIP